MLSNYPHFGYIDHASHRFLRVLCHFMFSQVYCQQWREPTQCLTEEKRDGMKLPGKALSVGLSFCMAFALSPCAYAEDIGNEGSSEGATAIGSFDRSQVGIGVDAGEATTLAEQRAQVAESEGFELPATADEINWDTSDAGVDYVGDQMMVAFFSGISYEQAESFVSGQGWRVESTVVWDEAMGSAGKVLNVTLPYGESVESAMKSAEQSDLVVYAEPNGLLSASDINLSETETQAANWMYAGWELEAVHAQEAWKYAQCAGRVSVAVLDSGVQLDHPDLNNVIDHNRAYDVIEDCALTGDDQGHGTAVAGVVAAQAGNGIGATGISYNANIIPIRIAYKNGDIARATYANMAKGIQQALLYYKEDNLKVINISYAGSWDEGSATVQNAVNNAYGKGVVVVASAGNKGETDKAEDLMIPADLNNVIGVIATDRNNERCNFSCYGDGKDISAPGRFIYTTTSDGAYSGGCWGTSFSAPIVAGTLALMFSCNSALTVEEAEHLIESTAVDLGKTGFDNETGWGLLNAGAAVKAAANAGSKLSVADATVSGLEDTYYTGLTFSPSPVVRLNGVTLRKGVDYDVVYQFGSSYGDVRQVTIFGKGSYCGVYSKGVSVMAKWPRLFGTDCLDTMRTIVEASYGDDVCDSVIVATDQGYLDALTASGFAGLLDCPVLMCDKSKISAQTRALLIELKPKAVYVVGGTSVLSDDVVNEIKGLDSVKTVKRIAGNEAADTANDIYAEGKNLSKWGDTAVVATQVAFQDALSGSPYAYAKSAPVFLVNTDGVLDDSTEALINAGGFKRVLLLGGAAVVKPAVESQIKNATKVRLAGAEAVDTSIVIAEYGLSNGLTANKMGIATSESYYDALSGVTLCGRNKAPMLLVSDGDINTVCEFVASRKSAIDHGYIFGGAAVVSASAGDALEKAML